MPGGRIRIRRTAAARDIDGVRGGAARDGVREVDHVGDRIIEHGVHQAHEVLVGRIVRPQGEDAGGGEVPVERTQAVRGVEVGVRGVELVARRMVDVQQYRCLLYTSDAADE